MEFDKLRLIGFKSFVDPTDVVIEPGLTGVVGPNGCGKSNLVEALRWVMGEASYKSVRGASMDDVIFAGSGRRPSRDTAEVTLYLGNTDRTAPAQMNDADALEVTRRIGRGVGSDYRVNGRAVRARDVQLLFADAATGSRSPSMVRQGQVAELIAAKPTERRNVLEEAAGISGLKARKHEATLRLSAAEQNLSRVEDVAGEVARQVEALRRQARQAERYRTLSADVRRLEATVHHLRWVEARTGLGAAEAATTAAKTALAAAAERQVRAATDEAAARHALPPLRDAAADAAARRQRVAAALATLDASERAAAEACAAATRQGEALAADVARQEVARSDAEAALGKLAEEERSIVAASAGDGERLAALQHAAREAAAAATAADRAMAEATEHAASVIAAHRAAGAEVDRARAEARRAAHELRRLEEALATVSSSDAVRRRDAARTSLAEADAAQLAAGGAEDAARAAEGRATEMLAEAEADVVEARGTLAQAVAARDGVEREVAACETEADGLRRLIATVSQGTTSVLDACTVVPGYEAAFAAALGEDLEAPAAHEGPVRWTPIAASADDDPPLPDGVEPIGRYVDAPVALARRIRQIGVGPGGGRLAPGQRVVSRDGALWRWDGFAREAGAPSAAAQRLAHRNRLVALSHELEELAPRRAAACAEVAAAEKALSASMAAEVGARADLKKTREALASVRRTLAMARETHGRAARHVAEADRAAEAAEHEAVRLAAERTAAARQDELAREALAAAEAAATAAATGEAEVARRDRAREATQRCRGEAVRAAQAVDDEERRAYGRSRRRERLAEEVTAWRSRLERAMAHGTELAARLAEVGAERDRLAASPSETLLERRRLTTSSEEAQSAERAARDALAVAEGAERDAVSAAREALDGLAAARETAGRADERLAGTRTRLAEVEAALTEALEVAPHEAARVAQLDPAAPAPDRAAAEARLDRLKAERTKLGGINLCAQDELGDIEARQGAMLAERDDLSRAIETLREGIRELDREARGRLTASFDAVDQEFRRLFTHLFGGGEARLVLTEADDPLDAGLDIVARPPGKTPQVLSLLSGGEQTLTATALIFAVFLTNPSPICVLDEIDAPLDDANVERFCNLLAEMDRATDTRFLIITHNPITMARMHRLYGVTMVERGVSQLVSVSLEVAQELRESA
ncbi:chromosome segregation SMC family protein [Acuticoccus sp.]|uniref:chromosome segregation SMC family protein n=1 Tax=Acuticoccus sp. TaxID=1904378 RepID=UPI003B529455